jgi:uncharacterized membrane-anchored protein
MRKAIALVAGLIVLVLANVTVYQREHLLAEGRVVLLALAPVDPRSLMQGDYMALDFQVTRDVAAKPRGAQDGRAVLTVDEKNVGTFLRFDDGNPLAPGQVLLHYRVRDGGPRIATNAFFFQEGDGDLYATARYGELRVATDGEAILTGLRDEGLRKLGRNTGSR